VQYQNQASHATRGGGSMEGAFGCAPCGGVGASAAAEGGLQRVLESLWTVGIFSATLVTKHVGFLNTLLVSRSRLCIYYHNNNHTGFCRSFSAFTILIAWSQRLHPLQLHVPQLQQQQGLLLLPSVCAAAAGVEAEHIWLYVDSTGQCTSCVVQTRFGSASY
jgi:hypothetical protein